jgi:hypothetical protein
LTNAELVERLEPPDGPVDAVLDTDTFNEIDDQFAVAYGMLAKDRLHLKAIYAAPFHNERSSGPEDGMRKSLEEIERVLTCLAERPEGGVHEGSTRWLTGSSGPEESSATRDLIQRAHAATSMLYVVGTGAITNVASALLIEPSIAEKIVVVWLGGHPHTARKTDEFNMYEDPDASRLVLDCGVPLVQVPCFNVAEHLRISVPEMTTFARGRSAIGDYLTGLVEGVLDDDFARSRVIWDIAPIAWLVNPSWVSSQLVASPILTDQLTWSLDGHRHVMRVCDGVSRDAIFADLFARLQTAKG